jgi:thioredoxin-related protein
MKITLPALLATMLLVTANAFSQSSGWLTSYEKALAQAKTENKAILLDFTGSDWCPYCIQMDKEVLTKQEFKDYAAQNLVLMLVDFPNSKPQSSHVKAQNQQLQTQFGVTGYPTFILVSPSGDVLTKLVGYGQGGPHAFIADLAKVYTPAPIAAPASASSIAGTSGTDAFDAFFHHGVDGDHPVPP